jgi:two-component system, chemotaxis family, sensor kinase CheA
MVSLSPVLINTLTRAVADLQTLPPQDHERLVTIGVALETVLAAVPAEGAEVRALLDFGLEGLQALYLDQEPDPKARLAAITQAVAAAEQGLTQGVPGRDNSRRQRWTTAPLGENLCRAPGTPAPLGGGSSAPPGRDGGRGPSASAAPPLGEEREEVGRLGSEGEALVPEFLIECGETMDRLDRDLVALEQYPADRDILFRIFRTLHTIKGNAGCLGFSQLEALAHTGEELLGRLLDGVMAITPEIISPLLALVDAIRAILSSLAEIGGEGNTDYVALIETVTRLHSHPQEHAPPAPARMAHTHAARGCPVELSAPLLASIPTAPLGDHAPRGAGAQSVASLRTQGPGGTRGAGPDDAVVPLPPISGGPGRRRLGDLLLQLGYLSPGDLGRALEQQKRGDQRRLGDLLIELGLVQPEQLQSALQMLAEARTPGISENSIRVQVPHLEALGALVGELGTIRDQIVASATCRNDRHPRRGYPLPGLVAALDGITTALQQQVYKIRLQPLGTGWSKFPRLVRDLALASGKQVQFEMEGRETLIDTTLVAAIKDSLLHLLRNGVDHGIEPPAVRVAQGKPAEGRLCLRAVHQEGQLTLEIADDGAGIDPERIRRRAVERGLLTAAAAAAFPEEELQALIFRPGFSTAEQVTSISGRGVGMDVVKNNILEIGGTLEIDSCPGAGTLFRIRILLAPGLLGPMEGERSAAGEGENTPQENEPRR